MRDKDLYEKRVVPAFNKMYIESINLYPDDVEVDLNILKECAVRIEDKHSVPYEAFYLPEERFKAIIDEACKGLRHWWKWPHRGEIVYSNKTIKEFKAKLATMDVNSFEYKQLYDMIKMNPVYKRREKLWRDYQKEREELEKLNLKGKELKKKLDELAKKYNLTWYSRDVEVVKFTLYLDLPTPNSSKKRFEELKEEYNNFLNWIESGNEVESFIPKNIRDKELIILMYKFYINYKDYEKRTRNR